MIRCLTMRGATLILDTILAALKAGRDKIIMAIAARLKARRLRLLPAARQHRQPAGSGDAGR